MEIKKERTKDSWIETLKTIINEGERIVDSDNRKTFELLNIVIKIDNPKLDIEEPINEMNKLDKWIYPKKDELKKVMFLKNTSMEYYYTYGARIFNYRQKINQVDDFIIPLLKDKPSSRRAIINLYDPVKDSSAFVKENPCLISIYFKIVDKKLTISTLIRSNDMFIGWPANIFQIFNLQKYVAEKLNLETGSITTFSHSAHIFEDYLEEIKKIIDNKNLLIKE